MAIIQRLATFIISIVYFLVAIIVLLRFLDSDDSSKDYNEMLEVKREVQKIVSDRDDLLPRDLVMHSVSLFAHPSVRGEPRFEED